MMTCFVTLLIMTILDTFEPSSKMLINTWLASTVLNSGIHRKTTCYGITPKKSVLNCRKKVFVVTFLKGIVHPKMKNDDRIFIFGWTIPLKLKQIFQTFEHIYLKMMGHIYSHLVAIREGDTGIFPDHKFMGLVQISLGKWTKTYTVSVVTWKVWDTFFYIKIHNLQRKYKINIFFKLYFLKESKKILLKTTMEKNTKNIKLTIILNIVGFNS